MAEREGDLRIPIISFLFCIFLLAGGILLALYVFVPDVSQPWFPIAALVFIGCPWIFWFMTYIYTCIKACRRRTGNRPDDRQISKRGQQMTRAATRSASVNNSAAGNSVDGARRVHFAGAVVVDGGVSGADSPGGQNGRRDKEGESSVTSSRECEMPLTSSV